jgi:type IV pilus assembly protein PilA
MLARIRKSMEEKDQGFTLIELLVVIIIIGILAAIAIPVFLNQRKKGWDSQAKSDARNLATLQETYFTDAGTYVVGSDSTAPLAITGLDDYKPSSNVTAVDIKGYDSDDAVGTPAAANTAAATNGFCVAVTSKSTATFVYDSLRGGLQPSTVTSC